MPELKIFRNPKTGYPDVPKMLEQMDDWSEAEKFSEEFWRLNNLYKIVDKNQRTITFVMKPEQADFYLSTLNHPRHIILKARQLGFSTLIQIMALDRALINSNETISLIAQNKDVASKIMESKIKFAYDHLPKEIRAHRPYEKSNREQFVLSHNSKIFVSVSARSGTTSMVHFSEMAKSYVEDPAKTKEFWTGTMPALVPGGLAIIESTAEGAVGDFYEAYTDKAMDAPQDPRTWMRHFYPWWGSEEYQSDYAPDGGFDKELKMYFEQLEQKHGIVLTEQQKNWYAGESRTIKGEMKQEYPSTAEEAFEQSSESKMWGNALNRMRALGMEKPTRYITNFPAIAWFDIGHDDFATCWCMQLIDEQWRCFAYFEIQKGDLSWFFEKFQYRGYRFKCIFLPWDSEQKHFGMSESTCLADEARNWGIDVRVVPRTDNKVRDIAAAGKFIPEVQWNDSLESGVPDGLKKLGAYKKRKAPDGGYLLEPYHDSGGACDAADAFRAFVMTKDYAASLLYEDDMNESLENIKPRRPNSITGY